jgi:hypothetical protein
MERGALGEGRCQLGYFPGIKIAKFYMIFVKNKLSSL